MVTPARRQYLEIKRQYPDAIVLFRLGDFYEMFDDDAKKGAEALQIALTSRTFGKSCRVPLAGVPYHALDSSLAKLLAHGYTVAVCEQLSPPGRGLIERGVVRVLTPGTVVEPNLLPERANNYLAAVAPGRYSIGLAYADVSTGEFAVTELSGAEAATDLQAELARLSPAEVLAPEGQTALIGNSWRTTALEPWHFDPASARQVLCRALNVSTLEGFGCEQWSAGVAAAGAILAYLERTNPAAIRLFTEIRSYTTAAWMPLDASTQRNLELTESARRGELRGSLLAVLDRTCTPMGARLLRQRLLRPLVDRAALEQRLDTVAVLFADPGLRAQLRALLHRIGDMERQAGRALQEIASPRELLALRDALVTVGRLRRLLVEKAAGTALQSIGTDLDPCIETAALIERAIAPPNDGRTIRPGFSAELDALRAGILETQEWLAKLEQRERERTGIRSLKVAFNKVFGYYIEVSKSNLHLVPADYVRKQTIVGGERFITPELKERELQVLAAEERIAETERRLFQEVQREVGSAYRRLRRTAAALAELDVALSLAEVAADNSYVRPELHNGEEITIIAGRHPVVEATQGRERFIPNDCRLTETERVLIITGPNMAGKSTYLRQVALIVLLAQIGSFVPAERARIGLVDRIFTRIGAQDDIAAGASTFMVEMAETANILRHATGRSLILLDEIGRGTSTYDGLAIARAVVEHLHDRLGARTLFATHYQELAALAEVLPRVANYHTAVTEANGEVVFLYRITPGHADRSYGIHVARLAGLPACVTERAASLLRDLEQAADGRDSAWRVAEPRRPHQPDWGREGDGLCTGPGNGRAEAVLSELLALDLLSMTPIDAMVRLYELQQMGRRSE